MRSIKKFVHTILLLNFIFFVSSVSAQTYQDDINNWYQTRVKNLTAENGWLNLVGLYWLKEGKNTFGSGKNVQIKFADAILPEEAGYFNLSNGVVTQYAKKGTSILVKGQVSDTAILFDTTNLKYAPVSAYKSLRWTVIKRGSMIGIRLRNLNSDVVTHFNGVPHFPADTGWVVSATLTNDGPGDISITNILGQVHAEKTPGKLYFTLQGHPYSLDALEENNKLFIIFADATSGESTYPTGRFLVAEKPNSDGKTTLDFNKAYNPPCAFSDYATCPVPPKQNVLALAITAGEKNYGHHTSQ